MTGLEPANDGTTTHCLNQLGHTRHTVLTYSLSVSIIKRLGYLLKIFQKIMVQVKNFTLNGQLYYTKKVINLFDLIVYFNYKDSLLVLEYNNLICNKKNWKKIFIEDQDQIEIVTIVGGG